MCALEYQMWDRPRLTPYWYYLIIPIWNDKIGDCRKTLWIICKSEYFRKGLIIHRMARETVWFIIYRDVI